MAARSGDARPRSLAGLLSGHPDLSRCDESLVPDPGTQQPLNCFTSNHCVAGEAESEQHDEGKNQMRKTVAGLFISLDGVIRLGTGVLSLTYGPADA